MSDNKKFLLRRFTDKLFGSINMSWWKVIAFAVAAAVVTFVFLTFPIFEKTSFHKLGETFEGWIFFAVIIIANCKKPLEAALKTFVFFLISQPLIYLFQVPFSDLGWQLFGYYKYWFIWTLLTLPMAFIGWYIRKKNWLSLLILSPALVFLTYVYVDSFRFSVHHFPYRLLTTLFCFAQVILYLFAFTPRLWQRLVGFFVPLAVVLVILFVTPQVEINSTNFLPDNPVLTQEAEVVSDNADFASVSISETGKDSMVLIQAKKYGTTTFMIKDGDREYRYSLEIYEDDNGIPKIRIKPIE